MLDYLLTKNLNNSEGLLIRPCFEDRMELLDHTDHLPAGWQDDFHGKTGETHILYPNSKIKKLFLIGLGPTGQIANAHKCIHHTFFKQQKNWPTEIFMDLRGMEARVHYEIALGIQRAQYHPGHFKSEPIDRGSVPRRIHFVTDCIDDDLEKWILEGFTTGHTLSRIMELVDLPANKKTPAYIANWVSDSGSQYGYGVEILSKDQLEEAGFHATLSVGQGSSEPTQLVKTVYNPSGKDSPPDFGLVGKGITFDTGGISIKPSARMHMMKTDMGGGAAVIGAVELAARLKLDIHIAGLIPLAENCVDGNSVKPGDVISSYSGKTIEVIDTDAEGRLVLADALGFMARVIKPATLVDLATLTGSSVRSLGYEAAALFSNNDQLVEEIGESSEICNERVWRLPIWEEYGKDLESDIADIRNLSSKPIAGAITAAKFLEFFVENHPKWAHLDIAGVAYTETGWTKERGATGFGVRLLLEMFKKHIKRSS